MIVERLQLGVYGTNCYIIGCEETKAAAVIDPAGDVEKILAKAKELKLKIKYIILTHGHGDHIGGADELRKEAQASLMIHGEDEALLLDASKNYSSNLGMENVELKPDRLVEDNEIIKVGELDIRVIHTPGHTQGSICLQVEDNLFSGDTLFKGTIGRTDLFGGSSEAIIESLNNKLSKLDDDVKVFPGHGPLTMMGKEKSVNPFIKK